MGSATLAAIATPAEVDTYTLDLSGAPGPTDVAIYTSGGLDTRGALLGAPTGPPVTNDDSDLADGFLDFCIVRRLDPGSYQINVMGDGRTAGRYTLHVEEITEEIPSEAGVTGTIAPGDAVDWYKIDRSSRTGISDDVDLYKLDMTGAADVWLYTSGALDTTGVLLGNSGNVVEANDDSYLSDGIGNVFIGKHLDAGVYYIAVSSYGTATGPYKLHAELKTDLGDSTSTAADLALDTPQTGIIGPPGDTDHFNLDLSGSADIVIYTSGVRVF